MHLLLFILACSAAGQLIYSEDFNANNGGFFKSGSSSFAWGTPTGDIGPGQAHSAPFAWGSNLAGDYGISESGFITAPIIDLSAHSGSDFVLSWWEHLETEPDFDFARVEASIDGGVAWQTIYGEFSGPISTPGWYRRSAVLDSNHAVTTFRFRFHLRSDESEARAGYYVDDISLLVLPTSHIYSEDFESGAGGFTTVGVSSWALGTPSTGPAAAASGVSAWATNLDGFYGANETGHLLSPVIDASPAAGDPTGILLSWQQFISSENTRDFASVQASTDGITWTTVYGPFSGPIGGPFHTWRREAAILPPVFAVATLQVRFLLATDDSIANLGFYLDDVALSRTTATIPSASPFSLSGTEDTPLPLALAEFANAFSANIATLRIEDTPVHGDLILGDITINSGVELSASQVDALFYLPEPDFAGTDSFTWNATDGLFFSPETPAVTLTLANTNDPPTGLTLSSSTIAENAPALIGTLIAVDPDGDDVHSFTVDDPRFTIAGNQLSANTALDHETEPTVTLAITATDALGFASQQTLTVTVVDVNEPPIFHTNNLAIDEAASHFFTSNDIAATDPEGAGLTYSVLAVTHGQFRLGGAPISEFQAGFINGTAINFLHDGAPTAPSYTLAVTDGTHTVTSVATITFNATNDAPLLNSATLVVSEGGSPPLTPAGFKATDEEDGPTDITYTLSAIVGGHFERTATGDIVTSFTQADINAFAIRFVDDDNETPPAFTVRIADSAGRSDGPTPGIVTYTPVNDPPVAIFLSNDSVPETPGATVASILVSDPDDTTHSFSTSDARFEVVANTLKLTDAAVVDHETEPSINLDITATDPGGESLIRSVSIDITNVNEAPTAIALSADSVDENVDGAIIGSLTVTDPDANSAHSFAISDFRFQVSDLELKLKPGLFLDHEAAAIIVITVTATDDGFPAQSFSRDFPITVNDLNDTPLAVHLDVASLDENDIGVLIGTFSVVDQDDGDTHSLAITDPRFELAGKQLSLAPGISLDHEAIPTLELAVSATDFAGAVLNTSVTLTIADRNEPPTGVALSSSELAESANAAPVGTIIVADPDADSANQNIVTVNDSRFVIDGSALRLVDGTQVDHETEPSINIILTVTDSGNNAFSASSPITLTVVDVNEPPTVVLLDNRFIDENAIGLLGTLSALDPDDGDSHGFSIDDARFGIIGDQLSLLTPVDHEVFPSIPVTLTATDSGGLTRDASLAIIIDNVNEAPVAISLDATAVVENFPDANIGAVTVSDPDANDSHTFVLSDARFAISNGDLHLVAPLDHETDDPTPLIITATDALGLANSASFSISVIDAPDTPSAILADNLDVPENAPGAIVGILTVVDDDFGDTHTLVVDDPRFEITGGDTLRLRSATVFDHEVDPAIPLQITATDSTGLAFSQPLTVTILDLNEPPTDITLANSAIAENVTGPIGALTVADQDDSASHSFTLSDGRFVIADGQLQLTSPIDHETEPTITLSVTATDDAGAVSRVFVIAIGDIDEPPTAIGLSNTSILENETGAVGLITITDPDDEPLEFTASAVRSLESRKQVRTAKAVNSNISVSDPNFEIIGDELRLIAPQDHETTPTLPLIITVDGFSQSFTVTITDANEPPTALALNPSTVAENSVAGLIGTLTVSDPDAGDSHTLAAADPRFVFLGATLRLAPDTSLDHEVDPSLDLVFTATDAGGLSFSDTLTVTVSDIDEPPSAITVAPGSIAENSTGSVGTITVIDPDTIAPIAFSDARFSIIGDQLHLVVPQDHETTPSITLDLSGFSTTIAITDIDEPPSLIALSNAEIAENLTGVVGTLTVTDPDGHGAPTLSDARFELVESVLHLIAPQDHETTPTIPLTITIDGVAQAFIITIADGNEPPTDIALANSAIPENSTGLIGAIALTDPDATQPVTLTDDRFQVIDDALHLVAPQDHETTPSIDVVLTSSTFSKTLTVTISDVDEPATAILLEPAAIVENSTGLIGTLTVLDPDAIAPLALDDPRFTLNGNDLHLALSQNHELTPTLTVDISGFSLTITITNVDEPPTAVTLSKHEIPENSTGLIGILSFDDPDDPPQLQLPAPFTIVDDQLRLLTPQDHEINATLPLDIAGFPFTIAFTDVNEVPTGISIDSAEIAENISGPIGAITVADPDDGDGHSFLVSDARFAVIDGVLHASSPLDHETTPSLALDIIATDGGGLAFTQTLSIAIADANEAPTALALSSVDIAENQPGASIAALTISDPDDADSHSVVTSDPRFIIADGHLSLAPGIALDFEAAAAIPLTLTATDLGGLSRAHTFTLIVFDANDPPSALALSNATIAESANSLAIGTLSASDQDGDSVSFSVDDPRFAVTTNTLNLVSGGLDFETEPSIALRVTATDARGASSTAVFSMTVTDSNEPPTAISLSDNTVPENDFAAAIGSLTVTDPDAGAAHVFTVDDLRFEVIAATLKLKGGVALDHETDPTVPLVITATDAANPAFHIDLSVTISVSDIDEPPTGIALNSAEIAENSAGPVGSLSIADPDETNSLTVSDPRFSVGEDLVLLAPLNHEVTPIIPLSITADGFTQAFTITIADVPEAPSAITLNPFGLPENADDLIIAEITASDEDANDDVTLSTDDPRFSLNGTFLRLRTGQAVNFETTPSLSVTITGTDLGGLERTETFTLAVSDVNEAPSAIALASTTVSENDASASLGAITVSDPDAEAIHFLSVDDPRFDITDGILSLEVALDRETEPTVDISITATDAGGLQIAQAFTITVSDINEPPTAITVAPASIAENSTGSVGTISISDPDAIDPIVLGDVRFQITGDQLHLVAAQDHETTPSITLDLSGFSATIAITNIDEPPTAIALSSAEIAENTTGRIGTLSVADPDTTNHALTVDDARFVIIGSELHLQQALDHETTPSLPIVVSAGGFDQPLTILIANANEAPTAVTLSAATLAENTLADIGTVTVTDPDQDDSHILAIDDPRFEIIGGILRPLVPLNHETDPTVPIRITATDAAGFANSADFTITVSDIDEPPTAITVAPASIAENSTGSVGTITVTDPDAIAPVTLTDPRFSIVGDQLHLVVQQDHESTPSITLDLSGFSVTVAISDANEAPTELSLAGSTFAENSTGPLMAITVADPDDGDSHSIGVSDGRFSVVDGVLTLSEAINHEAEPTVTLTLTATDVGGLARVRVATLAVSDVNEAPSGIALSAATIFENNTGPIGALTVSDPDVGAAHLLTADDARFEILDGQLRLREPLDRESTPSLPVTITATDLGDANLSTSSTFTITIANVDEPPTAIAISAAEFAENSTGIVGALTVTDPDSASHTLSLDDLRFDILDGNLRLLSPQDHEATPSIDIVVSTDGFDQPLTILISDVNEPPTGITLGNAEIAENATGLVGHVTVIDPDAVAALPTASAPFAIVDGALHLSQAQNHETTPSLFVILTAEGYTETFSVTIADVNEPPTAIALSTASVDENATGPIGGLSATDPDEGDSHVFSVADPRFGVVGAELRLLAPLDHESTPTLDVVVSSQGYDETFTIAVGDIDEPPTAIALSSSSIDEHTSGTVGILSVSDPDDGDTHSFTLDDTRFAIDGAELRLLSPLDHETIPSIDIAITTQGFTQAFTIIIADLNEPPTGVFLSGTSIDENASGRVGDLTIIDPDIGDSHVFTSSDPRFVVVGTELQLAEGIDHETTPSIPLTLTTQGVATTFTISIVDVDEPPTAITLSNAEIAENSPGLLGSLTVVDPDGGSHSFTLDDDRFAIFGNLLALLEAVDHETEPSIDLGVTAQGYTETITITISNVNEDSTDISLSNAGIAENSTGLIGTITVSDPDLAPVLPTTTDPSFTIIGDQLHLLVAQDHETTPSLSVRLRAEGYSEVFGIAIDDVNEPPSAITVSPASIAENSTGSVGTVSITDVDDFAPVVVSDSRFEVIGDQLHLVQALDHETTPSVTLTLDGFSTTVTITDVDEPPTAIAVSPASIAENSTGSVGTITITDPDAIAPVTVADPRFQIIGDQLHLVVPQNHETSPSIAVDVSGFSIAVSISDVDEPPTGIALSNAEIAENSTGLIGDIIVTDPDAIAPVVIADSRFQVIGDQLHLIAAQDHETTPTITLDLSGFSVTVDISDQNEPPAFTNNSLAVDEGVPVVLSTNDLLAADPDGDPLTFTPVTLAQGSFSPSPFTLAQVLAGAVIFTHDGSQTPPVYTLSVSDGALSVSSTATIFFNDSNDRPQIIEASLTISEGGSADPVLIGSDEEDDNATLTFTISEVSGGSYTAPTFTHDGGEAPPTFSVTVTDSGGRSAGPIPATINFTPVDDPPTAISVSPASIAENSTGSVGTISITDVDSTTPPVPSDARFQVIGDQLHLVAAQDHETSPSITFDLDGFSITVSITNIDEPPSAIALANVEIAENSIGSIGTLTITDPDGTSAVSVDDPRFSVGEDLVLLQPLDHEIEPSVDLVITADGVSQSFTLTVTDVDEPPTAIALANAEIAENSTGLIGQIIITDPDAIAPVVVTDPRFQVIDDQLHLAVAQDHETTPSITLDLSGFSITVTISDIDEPPTAITVSPASIAENASGSVGTIIVIDPDAVAPVTLSDARFQIVGDQLHLVTPQDHEASLSITVDLSGFSIDVAISDVNEPPTGISLSTTSIPENSSGFLATITLTDPDALSSVTVDDPRFGIIEDQLHLLTPQNRETTPTIPVTLSSNGFDQAFSITIGDVDEPPTAITVAPASIAENATGSVGTIDISDPDSPSTVIPSDPRFQVIGDQLHLIAAQDHETTSSITLDLNGFATTVIISDIDEPPTAIALSAVSIAENSSGFIGQITLTDPDALAAITVDDPRFTVIDSALHLSQALDHEATPTVVLTLTSASYSQAFTILITDINEPPTVLALTSAEFAENATGAVATILFTDPDAISPATVDDPRFDIIDGDLHLLSGQNHETTPSIAITISSNGFDQAFTIAITDIDEPPTAITVAPASIAENAIGSVGTISISDPDAPPTVVPSDPRFQVIGDQLHLVQAQDHETTPSITLELSGFSTTVTISDVDEPPSAISVAPASIAENSTGSVGTISIIDPDAISPPVPSDARFQVIGDRLHLIIPQDHETTPNITLELDGLAITVVIADLDEPATNISLSNSSVPENATGALIGDITVIDPDVPLAPTLTDPRFQVANGQLRLAPGVALDHEDTPSISLTISAGSFSQSFTITVSDINEPPTALALSTTNLPENSTGFVATISITDPEGDDHSPIVSDPSFTVLGDELHALAPFDHETTPTHTLEISGFSVTLSITDIDEPPTAISLSNASIPENETGVVGLITITDPDDATLEFTASAVRTHESRKQVRTAKAVNSNISVSDPDFEVVGDELRLTVPHDHETTPTIALTIAADGYSQSFIIAITDIDEAPTAIALDNSSIDENDPGAIVGTLTISDPDASGPATVSDDRFTIANGVLRLRAGISLDHETDASVDLDITVDGFTQSFTITVRNINEPPTAIALSDAEFAENATGAIGALTITDVDATESLTVSDPRFSVGEDLVLLTPLDHETAPTIQLTITADGFSQAFTISISDIDEPPIAITLSNAEIAENSTGLIGAITIEDPDAIAPVTLSDPRFQIIDNALHLVQAQDHETTPTLFVDLSGFTLTVAITNLNEPPTLTLADASVSENSPGAFLGPITISDPDAADSHSFTFDDPRFDIQDGLLLALAGFDHETDSSLPLSLTVTDAGGLADSATISITVVDRNEAPVSITLSNQEFAESAIGVIGEVSIGDPDDADSHVLTIDDLRFEFENRELRNLVSFDHETSPSTTVTITATDSGGLSISNSFLLTISDIDEPPTAITLSNAEIAENSTGLIGTITVTDPDAVAPITLSDPRFQIIGDALHLVHAQDHEVTPSITIDLSGFSITILISNIDEPPTAIALSNTSVDENSPGAIVGDILITDPDASGPITVDDARFTIANGQLRAQSFNHETTPSIDLSITVDGLSQGFTVTIRDLNEAPVLSVTPSPIPENQANVLAATLSIADPDEAESHQISVSDPRFELDGLDLILRSPVDFEAEPTISLSLVLSDSGDLSHSLSLQVAVEDANDPPSAFLLSGLSIPENATGPIGAISITDPDEIDPVAVDDADFAILEGVLQLLTPQDHETTPEIPIRLSSNGFSQEFLIQITPVDEPPTEIAISATTIPENSIGPIGALTITDPDQTTSVTVDDPRFEIVDGVLRLTTALDHETEPTVDLIIVADSIQKNIQVSVYNIDEDPTAITLSTAEIPENSTGLIGQIIVTDPDQIAPVLLSDSRFQIIGDQLHLVVAQNHEAVPSITLDLSGFSVIVAITDVDDPPSAISLSSLSISENSTGLVGAITITDEDSTTSITVDNPLFEILSGNLHLRTPQNHETMPTLSFAIVADSVSQTFTISIDDANDAPSAIALSNETVLENESDATIGTISVSDEDPNDGHTISVNDPRFIVENDVLKTASSLDKESGGITITITADDGQSSIDSSFDIIVNNVNEVPSLSLSQSLIFENTLGAIVGDITIDDPDLGDTHQIVVDDERFEIVNSQLKLVDGESLDAETEPSVVLILTVTDAGGLSDELAVLVEVASVNEAPNGLSVSPATILENVAGPIGDLQALDPDDGDSHAFTVTDPRFFVVEGVLHTTGLNHEAAAQVPLTVLVTDAEGLSGSFSVSISVEDVNEPPAVSVAVAEIAENDAGAVVGEITVDDPDEGSNVVLAVDDPRFEAGAVLKLRDGISVNHEDEPSISLIITATDGEISVSETLQVAVEDLNEAPMDISLSASTVDENVSPLDIGIVEVLDADVGDLHTALVSDHRFIILDGKLRVVQALDYESENAISIEITVTDSGGLEFAEILLIEVADVNEAPTFLDGGFQVDENVLAAAIGEIPVQDVDSETVLSFESSDSRFEIANGILKLANGVFLNHELDSSISLSLRVSDEHGLSDSRVFTVQINDRNDLPSATQLSNHTLLENAGGALIGELTVSDEDGGDSHSFAVDDPRFAVVDGALLLLGDGLDFEAEPSVSLELQTIDNGTPPETRTDVLEIVIVNENEAPTLIALDGNSIAENLSDQVIGTVTVSDPDEGDLHVVSLDDGRFSVENGELRADVDLDAEAESSVPLRLTATDLGGLSVFVDLNILVSNVNEPPTVDTFSIQDPAESAIGVTKVRDLSVILSASDVDSVINGWLITEDSEQPAATDLRWLDAPPGEFSLADSEGDHELFAWARDDGGLVSIANSATIRFARPQLLRVMLNGDEAVFGGWEAGTVGAEPNLDMLDAGGDLAWASGLQTDVRAVQALEHWRLLVRADGELTWDFGALAAGQEVVLQRIGIDRRPVEAPVAISARNSLEVRVGEEFELALGTQGQGELVLEPGWNLIGNPIYTERTLSDLFGSDVVCWRWECKRYMRVELDEVLSPKWGYWLYRESAENLTIRGLRSSREYVFDKGWELWAPVQSQVIEEGELMGYDGLLQDYASPVDRLALPFYAYWRYVVRPFVEIDE